MRMRHLITAVLILLSLGAQANTAVLACGAPNLPPTDCCDPHQQTPRCPSPGMDRLSCERACSTDVSGQVSVALEREQETPPVDPTDGLAVLTTHFYELLEAADFLAREPPLLEPPAPRYPSNPTYLATARLRL